ncbi:MAG: helix-turn-helix domain-containing protein [Candidatus Baltobacteraceae bacterium]
MNGSRRQSNHAVVSRAGVTHISTTDPHDTGATGVGCRSERREDSSRVENRGRLTGSDFGALLRRHRLAAGLSQEALAERARMSTGGIGALERGDRRTPQRETLALLVGALALDDGEREAFVAAAVHSGLPRRIGGASVMAGPWADKADSNLPLALKSFFGRETELQEIGDLVRKHRLVTLTGVGGLGKTETALRVGRQLNDRAGTPVCFVTLAPLSDPALVVTAVASALGVHEVPNRPLLETLVAYIKNKTLLLILDNCEHVIERAADVAEAILRSCVDVRLLTTSREPLRAGGEQSYRLPSLNVPAPETASQIRASDASAYAAISLFTDRARAVDHRFAVTDENAPAIVELCRRLDGIPLAIELAAARVSQFSAKGLAEKIDDRFRILAGGARTAAPRQQTMRATIDWSYYLLSAQEQRVFERLSVFAGGCTLETATTVCADEEAVEGDVLDLLSSLIDKSMLAINFEADEPRYHLLESFRHYAREKLVERGDREAAWRRHAFAYLALAERIDDAYYTQEATFLALGYAELDNWRAALHFALVDGTDVLLGQRLVAALSALWVSLAPVDGRRWLVRALDSVDERTPTSVLAKLNCVEAQIADALGEFEASLASSDNAIAHYRSIDDPLGVARGQVISAHALVEMGRFSEATLLLNQALTFARDVGNRVLMGRALSTLGGIALFTDAFVAARDYITESLIHLTEANATIPIAWVTITLGAIETRAGDAELALRYVTDALQTFQGLGHPRGVAVALRSMAEALIVLNRYRDARACARRGLNVAREHHLDVQTANALQQFAAIAALEPQSAAAGRFGSSRYLRAARVLGFVNARLIAIMGTGPRDLDQRFVYEQIMTVLRGALGADRLASLCAEGAAMPEEEVVELALL